MKFTNSPLPYSQEYERIRLSKKKSYKWGYWGRENENQTKKDLK